MFLYYFLLLFIDRRISDMFSNKKEYLTIIKILFLKKLGVKFYLFS